MRCISLALVLCLSLTSVSFQLQERRSLKIIVTNIRNAKGEIEVNIFNSANGFPGEKERAIQHARGKAVNGSSSFTFDNVPFGAYAISIYHDENNDGKVNRAWYGKPIEGAAVSNNAKGSITGPPSFEAARFDFNAKAAVVIIKMNYF